MNVSEEILQFGSAFNERLDENLLNVAMDYVSHGENKVALDSLLGYLYEHDIGITLDEFDKAMLLAKVYGIDDSHLAFLKTLII